MSDTLIFGIGSFVATLCLVTIVLLAWAALQGEDGGHYDNSHKAG